MGRRIQAARWHWIAAVGVGVMIGMGGARETVAAQIYESASFSRVYVSGSVSVDPFDPSLGRLTGVDISVGGGSDESWELRYGGSQSSDDVSLDLGATFMASGPGFSCSQTSTDSEGGSFFPGEFTTMDVSVSTNDSAQASDLSSYEGAWPVMISLGYFPICQSDSFYAFVNTPEGWSGSISVDYSYIPAGTVPEPSALSLGGLASLLVAGWGRLATRRRSAHVLPPR